jgi:hypothetical protein
MDVGGGFGLWGYCVKELGVGEEEEEGFVDSTAPNITTIDGRL